MWLFVWIFEINLRWPNIQNWFCNLPYAMFTGFAKYFPWLQFFPMVLYEKGDRALRGKLPKQSTIFWCALQVSVPGVVFINLVRNQLYPVCFKILNGLSKQHTIMSNRKHTQSPDCERKIRCGNGIIGKNTIPIIIYHLQSTKLDLVSASYWNNTVAGRKNYKLGTLLKLRGNICKTLRT